MEYYRDPRNQIYADIAYRLGRILTQYERTNVKEEKFESTLCIAVLHSLITNCRELINQMDKKKLFPPLFNTNLENSIWGVNLSCWVENTFNKEFTLRNFIYTLRNSVSHPTRIDADTEFPSTGYTTKDVGSGTIQKYIFINSPDTLNNKLKELSKNEAEYIINILKGDIEYTRFENKPYKYYMKKNGKPFIRISIIELTKIQLVTFVKCLANYLAQPIQKNWDGKTINKDLIAA